MQLPTGIEKRTVLISEADTPLAVVGLRPRGKNWEPITQGTNDS
jgi:hypothetical protein